MKKDNDNIRKIRRKPRFRRSTRPPRPDRFGPAGTSRPGSCGAAIRAWISLHARGGSSELPGWGGGWPPVGSPASRTDPGPVLDLQRRHPGQLVFLLHRGNLHAANVVRFQHRRSDDISVRPIGRTPAPVLLIVSSSGAPVYAEMTNGMEWRNIYCIAWAQASVENIESPASPILPEAHSSSAMPLAIIAVSTPLTIP
jgi:hypothetical protein